MSPWIHPGEPRHRRATLAELGEVALLDESTSGLHLADVENLLALLDKSVEYVRQ